MIENTFIKLPFGIYREDAIIRIECDTIEEDNGIFKKKHILPAIRVHMIDNSSQCYIFTSIEKRNDVYNECIKILTTNN